MSDSYLQTQALPDLSLWQKRREENGLMSCTLELTARCNNNCRHCYINLPVDEQRAQAEELTYDEITRIVDQSVDLGVFWCLLTGGEPLLRDDFEDIYLYLKRKGVLVSVFTNATLITRRFVELFKKYPPRDLEVTVYGLTRHTYAAVTRRPDLFDSFQRGLDLLLTNHIPVNLKNVTMKANLAEFETIAAFCRKQSKAPFRFDPFLHLRLDRDTQRNAEILAQRLSPEEIATLERSDEARFSALERKCDTLLLPNRPPCQEQALFSCGVGLSEFVVSHHGYYRPCASLFHPDYLADLRTMTVAEAYRSIVSRLRARKSTHPRFLRQCGVCPIINLCFWCPAHAYLETGELELPVDSFCRVAEKRRETIAP